MNGDPLVLGLIAIATALALYLLVIGVRIRNGVHDEPTLNTRGADPDDPTTGAH